VTEATPPEPPASPAPGAGDVQEFRRPRKRFILVGLGIGMLIVLLIGLFTSFGSGSTSSGGGSGGQPQPGDPVPSFAATNIGPSGGRQVSVSANGGGRGRPTVLLFFGNWCASCHEELPPLAAAVRQQDAGGGALAGIRVVGVDSEDSTGDAKSFIQHAGVTFPVAYDPNVDITEGTFDFHGDPYAVFVKADGTVSKVVAGAQLGPAAFTADERALIPSGS
jgi:cytochrome c biogenesis protein CcmG, thiol:disulfide interchange protein DsbE